MMPTRHVEGREAWSTELRERISELLSRANPAETFTELAARAVELDKGDNQPMRGERTYAWAPTGTSGGETTQYSTSQRRVAAGQTIGRLLAGGNCSWLCYHVLMEACSLVGAELRPRPVLNGGEVDEKVRPYLDLLIDASNVKSEAARAVLLEKLCTDLMLEV